MVVSPAEPGLLAVLALVLLAAGVVASLVPLAPGGLLSLAGVGLYWYATGFADPGPAVVAGAALLALAAVVVDALGGAVAAAFAGTSGRVAAAAGLVGFLLVFVAGPFGVLAGILGVVYFAEQRGGASRGASLRTAGRTLVGVLVANGVQFLLTSVVLVGFLAVAFL